MKLVVIFEENKEDEILYSAQEIVIHTTSSDRIQSILLNDDYKQANLDFRNTELEIFADFDLDVDPKEQTDDLKAIEVINKAISKSFTINDFDEHEIKFNKKQNIKDSAKFLETIKGDIILNVNGLSKENINALKEINFKDEPQIDYDLNIGDISLSEFLDTMDIIQSMETSIKRFALSPIEQLMLLYDLVRNRIFKYGDEKDRSASRDLNRVLKEEEIVCAGYSNIFAAVANYLRIPTFVKTYIQEKNHTQGHATNVSYVYDDLYDKYFALEFDATWNSRKSESDNKWINNYDFFGQTENFASIIKSKKGLLVMGSYTNKIAKAHKTYQMMVKTNNIPFCVNNIAIRLLKLIKELYQYYQQEDKIAEIDSVIEILNTDEMVDSVHIDNIYNQVKEVNNKSIPLEMFMKMLYRVRRIEHSLDPVKYPLDFKIIENIVGQRYGLDKLATKLYVDKTTIENLEVLSYIKPKVKNKIKYDADMMKFLFQIRNLAQNKEQEKGLTNK